MAHLSDNVFFIVPNSPPNGDQLSVPWLTRGDDPRPKCTLVLGDGFTQGFLHAHSLSDLIKSSVPNHFRSWPELRYHTSRGETKFKDADPNFWDAEKWPRLFAEWRRTKSQDPADLYRNLAQRRINPDRVHGRWSVNSSSIEYELRCYLWHQFRSWEHAIQSLMEKNHAGKLADSWVWPRLLHLLLSEYRVTVVNFNYDRVFEGCASGPGSTLEYLIQGTHAEAERAPANTVYVIKIHGSIELMFDGLQERTLGPRVNAWLDDCDPFTLERNVNEGGRVIRNKLERIPVIPELVPPGHQGDHLCNPTWAAPDLARAYLAEGDLTIFCGLSAAEPDTAEVKTLVESIPSKSLIMHIGLEADRTSPLANLLSGSSVEFFDAGQLKNIPKSLLKSGLLTKNWEALFGPSEA